VLPDSEFNYLLAEHARLESAHAAMVLEFRVLGCDRTDEVVREKLRYHRMLIANHRLAIRWMRAGLIGQSR